MRKSAEKAGFLPDSDMLLLDMILHRPDRVNCHLLHSLEMSRVHVSSGTFFLMLLTIDEHAMDTTKSKKHEDETSNDLYIHVGSILHKYLQNRFVHYLMMTGGRLLCLMGIPQRESGKGHWSRIIKQLRTLCAEANSECKRVHGGEFSVVISYPRIGPENLASGYQAALDILAYYDFMEEPVTFSVEENPDSVQGSYNHDLMTFRSTAQSISHSLQARDVFHGEQMARESLQAALYTFPHSMAAVQMRSVTFSTLLIAQLMQDGLVSPETVKRRKSLQELTNANTRTDLLSAVAQLLQMVELQQDGKRENPEIVLVERIYGYIAKNLDDVNLNVSAIAEHFQLTQPALSTKFKKYSGEGLSNYISKARLEKAKQLLTETELPLEEIAAKVGYGSVPTLYRAFRKYENQAPGCYRKLAEQWPIS